MACLPENMMALEARIRKIETQNRRLKTMVPLLIIAFLAVGAMGGKMGPSDAQFKQITVQGITIVDGGGNKIIEMGSGEKGTGLRILNKAGNRVVGIGITADERGGGILVADNKGEPRIGLGMDADVPSIAIVDENGKKILAIGGDKRGYGFVVMDGNEVERAGLGFKDGNTGLMIYDDYGQYVRGIIRKKNGDHYYSYVDGSGKEIIKR